MSILDETQDFFPIRFAANLPDVPKRELERKLQENTSFAMAGIYKDELEALDGMLAGYNLKRGELIGAGGLGGLTFALETLNGQRIDSAVVRFDQKAMT